VKKYFQSGIVVVLILWLVGALIYLPWMEPKLTDAAKALLADPSHGRVFEQVRVTFSGQEATLTGAVAEPAEKDKAAAIVAKDLRLEGWFTGTINPVIAVHNEIVIDPARAPFRPRPWLIVSVFGGNQRIDGVLCTGDQRQQLLESIAAKLPAPATPLNNQVAVAANSLPAPAWDGTVANLPDLTATPQDQATIAISPCDGTWTTHPATVDNATVAAALKISTVKDNEITHALSKLRSWKPPTAEELQQRAAQKAADDAAAKAKADEAAKKQAAMTPAATNTNPPYLGATAAEGSLRLFGILPTEADRASAVAAAKSAFPTFQVDGAAIQLDPTRILAQGQLPKFPAPPTDAKPFVLLATYDGTNKLYPADVFNSEISRDFAAISFAKDELTAALYDFRVRLASTGSLPLDPPWLSLFTDGKVLNLIGELADSAAKEAVLKAVKAANPDFELADQLAVTPLVTPVSSIQSTVESAPKFTAEKPAVAAATPGQAWRSGVVHAVPSLASADRSKDVERAINQMRQILAAVPAASFEIVGHTDDTGAADANTKLSLERAEKLAAQAAAAGIPAAILATRGAGPAEPIAPNKTAAGKALNRRVDVRLK
jgi:flagellar motor protein MotB